AGICGDCSQTRIGGAGPGRRGFLPCRVARWPCKNRDATAGPGSPEPAKLEADVAGLCTRGDKKLTLTAGRRGQGAAAGRLGRLGRKAAVSFGPRRPKRWASSKDCGDSLVPGGGGPARRGATRGPLRRPA